MKKTLPDEREEGEVMIRKHTPSMSNESFVAADQGLILNPLNEDEENQNGVHFKARRLVYDRDYWKRQLLREGFAFPEILSTHPTIRQFQRFAKTAKFDESCWPSVPEEMQRYLC